MPRVEETVAAIALQAFRDALERHDDEVAAMEAAILALDRYRAANGLPMTAQAPIHADTLHANRLKARAAVVHSIADAFIQQESSVTIDDIAMRLETTSRKVMRMMRLKGRSGRGVDQVSDLLFALGAELDFRVAKKHGPEPADAMGL
ncbi:hypothetical protein SAMN05444161_2896 [Rhizobiales bacterium GAS191]|jgi:hypothetical protein|nr:hypothetical protein SAMN05519103_02098 [Rhizobiales bacterium GAS113]SEB95375.1 hypothetical protein SAMN05519104_0452 [Rhizobiales bacterium GAS188]SED27640.1 hypothetical protein SAMN05444161_2896 [Rhizobiales bacterium GAS191]